MSNASLTKSFTLKAALLALAAALLVTVAVGCGGSDEASGRASTTDENSGALKYAQCMREQGVNVPDPDANGMIPISPGGGGAASGGSGNGGPITAAPSANPKFAKAEEACSKHLTANAGTRERLDEFQDAALEFARCMRANGVSNFPDPKLEGGRLSVGGPGFNPNDPAVQKATAACADKLPIAPSTSG